MSQAASAESLKRLVKSKMRKPQLHNPLFHKPALIYNSKAMGNEKGAFKSGHALLGIILILVLMIVIQNTEVATLKILFWQVSMSRIFLYPLIFLAGLGTGLIAAWVFKKGA